MPAPAGIHVVRGDGPRVLFRGATDGLSHPFLHTPPRGIHRRIVFDREFKQPVGIDIHQHPLRFSGIRPFHGTPVANDRGSVEGGLRGKARPDTTGVDVTGEINDSPGAVTPGRNCR